MMRRARSSMSDASDGDGDLSAIASQELTKLQRQYRIMEGDRKAYTDESQNLIRKQKSSIECLEQEKQELLKELRLADSRTNQEKDDVHTDTLVTLSDCNEMTDNEIEEERRLQIELDCQIREWEKKIKVQHKNMGGVHMSSQHTVQTQKTIRTLENRLDQAKQEFCSQLAENAKQREEIESLRVERCRFDNLYKKLEKELSQLQKKKGESIESSTQAYDARDEAQAKIILLKEKADKDLQQHQAEMKELLRCIDHDRRLREFMGIKGQERQEDPQLVAWRQKKEAMEAEKKKENQDDSVETYEAAFDRIKQLTNEDDLDALVSRFIQVEDTNFALFNFVNEQNNEIEMLNEQICEIQTDIQKFNRQGIELEDQRKKILKELEDKQAVCSKEADEYEQKIKEISKILDQLRAGIDSLFNKINCDRSAIDDMLGAAAGVTDGNMIQYLGIVEQRTNELLAIQTYLDSKDQDVGRQEKPVGLLGPGPAPPQQIPPVLAPAVGDEYESDGSDDSDGDARPMTRGELRSRVMKTVRKRESAAKKDMYKFDLSNAREKTQKKKKDTK